jgi:hypothetical protein
MFLFFPLLPSFLHGIECGASEYARPGSANFKMLIGFAISRSALQIGVLVHEKQTESTDSIGGIFR